MCNEALSRRNFLKLLGTGALAATIDAYSNPFTKTVAYADPLIANTSAGRLILVFLAGGPSATMRPVYRSEFYDRFPTLSFQPEDSLPLNNSGMPIGLHPQLTYLKNLYDAGELAVVNEVGYPNPNRSHAESTAICDSGIRSMKLRDGSGWGTRLVALEGAFGGFSFSSDSLWARGGQGNVRRGSNLASTFTESNFSYGNRQLHFEQLRDNLLAAERSFAQGNKNAQYVLESLHRGIENSEHLLASLSKPLPSIDVEFPSDSFGRQCQETASLALSDLGVKAFRLSIGGFDTHANEGPRLSSLLSRVNAGLEPLIKTLKAGNIWNSTTILLFGEFSRTFENLSGGTDHGHAGPMLVASGAGIKTSVIGDPLFLNAKKSYVDSYNVDFRQVILESAAKLGYPTDGLFPEVNPSKIGLFT